jgi:L-threonylcarbamoyladenylate synthase
VVSAPADAERTAVDALRAGLIVLVPTDTVYGLAVDPTVPGATQRLFAAKGRGRDIPIAVLVADTDQAWSLAARPVRPVAQMLAGLHWPGALTLVVERDPSWVGDIGDSRTTIGLRCPDNDLVRRLCREVGPLATTSANPHRAPTPATAEEAAVGITGIAVVIDGGPLPGLASTVLDCTVEPPAVLRQGAILL